MGSRRRDRRENRSPPPTPPFSSQGLNPPATRVEPHRSAPRRAGAAPPRRVGRAEVKGAPGPGVGASGRQAGPSGALPRGLGPHSHPAAAVPTAASNPRPDGRLRSRGRGRDAEAARARPEPGPAQPVSAAGGRRRPRLPRFCSASASCSPRHAHRARPPSPSPPSRGRTPPQLGSRRGLSRPFAADSVAGAASGGRPSAADPGAGEPVEGRGGGVRRIRPTAPAPPAGPLLRAGPGRGAGRGRAEATDSREAEELVEIPGAAPGLSAGGGGGEGWVRTGAALGEHAASAPQAEEAAGNESTRPGRPRCTRADSVGGRCLRGDFPPGISPHPFSFRFHAPAAPCHNRLVQGDAPPYAGPLRPERLTLGS